MSELEQLTAVFGVETVFWASFYIVHRQIRRTAAAATVPTLLRRCTL